jgi:hypothetical protein
MLTEPSFYLPYVWPLQLASNLHFFRGTFEMAADINTFLRLELEYFELEIRWRFYRQLFCGRKADRLLLRQYLSSFTTVVKETLEDDLFIRVMRLLDKDPNVISLWDIVGRLPKNGPSPVRGSLHAALTTLEHEAASVRLHRNKRIAHFDSRRFSNIGPVVLPAVKTSDFSRIIRRLEKVILRCRRKLQPEVARSAGYVTRGDGKSLMLQLRRVEGVKKLLMSSAQIYSKDQLRKTIIHPVR